MKFDYKVSLRCSGAFNAERCSGGVGGFPFDESAEAGRKAALEAARRQGWAQIGEDMLCPACAGLREQAAGQPGHQAVAAAALKLGERYTVAQVLRLGGGVVMVRLAEMPTQFFNCEQFEEVAT